MHCAGGYWTINNRSSNTAKVEKRARAIAVMVTDTQWAAVIIQRSSMMLPPQVWYQPRLPRRWTLTCHGHPQRFASWPPTMRLRNSGDTNGTPHRNVPFSCKQHKFTVECFKWFFCVFRCWNSVIYCVIIKTTKFVLCMKLSVNVIGSVAVRRIYRNYSLCTLEKSGLPIITRK